jgi:hypothetical protein
MFRSLVLTLAFVLPGYLGFADVAGQTGGAKASCATLQSPADNAINLPLTGVSVNWQKVNGATGYKVYFGTSSTPPLVTTVPQSTSINVNAYSHFLPDLNFSTTYYWKIVPYDGSGDAVGCATRSFTTFGSYPRILVDTVTSCPGQQVLIPVYAQNVLQNVGSVSITLVFDPTRLVSPASNFIINLHPAFQGGILFPTNFGNEIRFSWFNTAGANISGANTKLFDLVFTYLGGDAEINFSTVEVTDLGFDNGSSLAIEYPGLVYEQGSILNQPVDASVSVGDPASFSLSAPGAIGYQWQIRNGAAWMSLANSAPYSGVLTSTLNISAATVGMDGAEYRCLVTGPCAKTTFTSDTVTLDVSSGCNNAVANAGVNQIACAGSGTTLSGSALDYASVLWTSAGDGNFTGANTLTPNYTPGPNDEAAGSVVITLTAYATPPCTDDSDTMTLTIVALPAADAGSNETTCEGTPFDLSTSTTPPTAGAGNSGVFWMGGSGSFTDPTLVAPTYNPGGSETGPVTLTMMVFGDPSCPPATDVMTLTITPGPSADAGSNENVCAGQSFNLGNSATPPSASNYTSLLWTSLGTGTLTGETTLTPTYTPGAGETGSVPLLLTASKTGCQDAFDIMNLTIVSAPSATISGGGTICPGGSSTLSVTFTGTAPWTFVYSAGGSNQAPITTSLNPYTISVSPAATTAYALVSVESGSCNGTVGGSATVTVSSLPNVTASATINPICAGQSTTISATGASTYSWSHSLGTNSSYSVSPTTTTIYSVTGTSAAGCTASASVTVTVNSVPTVGVSAGDNTLCLGESTLLTATGATTYAWSQGGSGNTATVSPAGTTTYTVTGTSNGCSNTASVQIIVNPLPTVGITADEDTLCEGGSAQLTASGAVSYAWSPSGSTASINVTPSATTTYTVTGTDGNGCQNTDSQVIVVNAVPVANAGTDQSIPGNTSTTLSGSASNGSGNYTYAWEPAALLVDPSIQNPVTVSLGSTTVFSLVVTDANTGCISAAATVTVTVTGAPLAVTASATPDVICTGETTVLEAVATGGSGSYTYAWTSAPAGFTSSLAQPSAQPTVNTRYYVTVNDGVKTIAEDSVDVQVNPVPTVAISATDLEICIGESVQLTASGASTYAWAHGPTSAVISVNPTATTTYTVTGTQNGCDGTASVTIVVNNLPNVGISASDLSICVGESSILTASGATSYAWSTLESTTAITVNPVATTVYTVTGTDGNGCTSTASATVVVNALPTVVITASDDSLCIGGSATLTASGAQDYVWSTTESTAAISVNPSTTSTYTVTAADANGCTNTAAVTITVNTLPTLVVAADDDTLCAGESTNIVVGGAFSYEWSTLETGDMITVTPGTTTSYTVTGTDVNGCVSTASITITVLDLPIVDILASDDEICEGETTILTASGAATYVWNTTETAGSISVSPTATSLYTVTGTDAFGCTGTATIEILVNDLPVVAASADPAVICAGQTSELEATGALTYAWSNGGSAAVIQVNPSTTTTYTVTGTDINGCVNTASVTVTVNDLPVANAGTTQLIPFNTAATLSGSASGGSGSYTYAWSPAAQLVDPLVQNPTTVALTSSVTYTLTVTDATTGCVGAPASVIVNVAGAPLTLSLTASPQVICQGSPSQLLATADGGSNSYTYTWASQPAGFTANVANPVVNPTVTTTYYVTVDDGSKASLNDSVTVTVNIPPDAYAGPDAAVCAGTAFTVSGATATNSQSIAWTSNGAGTLSGANTLTPTYTPLAGETGVVTLTLTVNGLAPCAPAVDEMDLTINAYPVITSQPANATVVEPTAASFNVVATGAVSYQWEISTNGGTTFNPLSDNATYSGTGAASLAISATAASMNAYKYRCVISANGCDVTSNSATLNVSVAGATIVTTAISQTACPGDTVTVPITVQDFQNVASFSLTLDYDPSVLTFIGSQNPNPSLQALFPMIINSGASSIIFSWFSVTTGNIGTSQLAELRFIYNGGTSALSWDVATSGNCEYTSLTNTLPATFIDGQVTPASQAPVITTQPLDQNIVDGDNASFSVMATGATDYQWEVSLDGGNTWNPVVNNVLYSGGNSSTLNLTGATLLNNFYQFRCVVSEATCGLSVTSQAAELNVSPAGSVATSAGSASACPGSTVIIPVTVANMSTVASISLTLDFDPLVLGYSNIQNLNPALSATAPLVNAAGGSFQFSWFSITPASISSGTLFEIVFNYFGGSSDLSWDTQVSGNCEYTDFNSLILPASFTDGQVTQLATAPLVTTQPVNASVIDGDTAYFSVAATGASTFQWQISTNGGFSFTNLSNNATYSGTSTATLAVNGANLLMNFHQFRCIVTESVCGLSNTSNPASLGVVPNGAIATTAGNVTACPGDLIQVPVLVSNLSAASSISLSLGYDPAVLTYIGVSNLNPQLASGSSNYNGVNGVFGYSWFSITPAFISNDTLFIISFTYHGGSTALVWDILTSGNCEFTDVNNIVMPALFTDGSVNPASIAPVLLSGPANTSVPTLSTAMFSVTATGANAFAWEMSNNGGITWLPVINGGIYSGATTNTLQLSAVNLGMQGYQYRCILTENVCGFETTSGAAILNVTPITAATSLGSALACPGDTIVIPIQVQDLYDVATISLTLNFNGGVLSFAGSQNIHPSLALSAPNINGTASSVGFSWFSLTPANIGSGTIAELKFVYLGGSTALTWDLATPGNTEYGDINTNLIPSTYVNGSVGFAGIPAVVSLQPANAVSYVGFTASFSVTATQATAYQWQVSTDGGTSWNAVVNGASYAGATTATLQVSGLSLSFDGYQYRCLVSGTCNLVTPSNAATLTVMAQPPILTIAPSVVSCEGSFLVPITVEDFNNVATISLGLLYNPSIIHYTGYTNVHPQLASSFFQINAAGGEVFISWFSFTPANLGTGKLFDLAFTSVMPGTSALSWDLATPGTCQYTNAASNTLLANYTNGSVTINPDPQPMVSGSSAVCAGGASSYSTISTAGNSYFWTVTGGVITSGQNTAQISVSWGGAGTGSVSVMETIDATGCYGVSPAVQVSINIQPAPVISGDLDVCAGEAGAAYSTTASAGHDYVWIVTGGAITAGQGTASILVDWGSTGTGSVQLTETDPATGCSASGSLSVNIHILPVPSVSGATAVCEGATAETYTTAFNAGSAYVWTVTGGTITGGQNTNSITVDWGSAGNGTVEVTETISATGCNAVSSLNVIINALPAPVISGADTVCAEDLDVIYSTALMAGHSYAWTVTGGTITSGQNTHSITIEWGAAGTGSVGVTETIDATGCLVSATFSVVINALPVPAITGQGSVCEFYTGAGYSTAMVAGNSYTWVVTGGTITAGQGTDSITVSWGTQGLGLVEVTETTAEGCTDTDELYVSINFQPSPVITGTASVCANSTGHVYSTTHTPGNTYTWVVSGGTITSGAGTNSITVDWGIAGAGTVDLNVTTSNGCTANAQTISVTINALPAVFNVTGGGSFCANTNGVAVGLDGSVTGVNYTLYINGTATSTVVGGTGSAISFGMQTTAGTYTVVATVTATGCTLPMGGSALVSITPVPTITVQPLNAYVDEGSNATFTVTAANATGYVWQMSLNSGTSWNPLANGPEFSGVSTNTLTVLNTTMNMTGRLFRVVVSGTCPPSVNSSAVSLTVNPVITTTIGAISGCAGTFVVPVNVQHFIGVASISFSLQIDTSEFQLTGYQNLNPAISGGFPALINLLGDKVKFSWFSLSPATIGDGQLVELVFTSNGGYTDLVWETTTSGACEYNTMLGAPITSIWVNGSITANPLPMVFQVTGGGSYCAGGTGLSVGLDGSTSGVNYALYLNGSATGNVLAGNGNALDFGLQTADGSYTVVATNAATGCESTMTGSALVSILPAPASFQVTGGGERCADEPGLGIGLGGSETGVTYALYFNGVATGTTAAGTGNAISFGTFTNAGTYTVMATNDASQCSGIMSGQAVIIVNPLPTVFNVTGGGSFCDNGQGVAIGLDGSETGITYTLYLNGTATATSVNGTGSALSFGLVNVTGNYTVYALNAVTGCAEYMSGTAVVNLYPNPSVFNVSGGGTLCSGGNGYTIDLSSSQTGVSYTLYLNGTATSQVLQGTGSALSFPVQTAAGTYTVMATDDINGCSVAMSGSAVVVVNPLPTAFQVTGGGTYCVGGNGTLIGLSGSETGIEYTLYLDGISTGSVLVGTGSAISFGLQTATGTYTVMASNTTTLCSNTMMGSVNVTISALPVAYAGGYAIICEGESTTLNAGVSAGTSPYTYAWTPAAGLNDPTILQPTASPSVPTYYVLVVTDFNGCTSTDTAIVVVNPRPIADAGLDKTIYAGSATMLNGAVIGGVGPFTSTWTPGTSLNDPSSLTPIATPAVTTTYTLLVTDANGCSDQDEMVVTVSPIPAGYSITGKVTYDNGVNTALTDVSVYLSITAADTTVTDPLGNYIFPGLTNGSYQTNGATTKAWGGVNSLDALLIAQYFQGTTSLSGLKLGAADVDGNGAPNANDAMLVLQRSAGVINNFPINKDWLFEQKSILVAGADMINNFQGICYGDVNGSHLPGTKAAGFIPMSAIGSIEALQGMQLRLPISTINSLDAAALSLGFRIPAGLRILGVEMAGNGGNLAYHTEGDLLRVEWYSLNSRKWNAGEEVLVLNVEVTDEVKEGFSMIDASVAGNIQGESLGMPEMSFPKIVVAAHGSYSLGNNYPNPFNLSTEIRFELPVAANIRLSVFNLMGEEVKVLAEGNWEAGNHSAIVQGEELAPGTYLYRLVAQGEAGSFVQTRKMIVTR